MEQGAEDVPVVYLHEIKRQYTQGETTLTILNGAKLALWAGQSVALTLEEHQSLVSSNILAFTMPGFAMDKTCARAKTRPVGVRR